ncbi:TDT family transporter [uncultured Fusobacterium sp.]|uniref:TDT family transporter n=1 Tax=uncultured Fusobacterium sp. TaxID=159267 RepID=UPI0025D8F4FD|nr:TDT family transporter [uncultured Fusobacterium sp.]
MTDRLKKMPVPLLPTMVGACTLSNVYLVQGFPLVRHITMISALAIWLIYLIRFFIIFETCKTEYKTTVPSSLYAGFTMLMMILGSYIFDFNPVIGKIFWSLGLGLHALHIFIFTYGNIITNFNIDTFVPSYFVTYNGIMVSVVVGGVMKEPTIGKLVTYYGIGIFTLIIPFMIHRLIKHELKDIFYHTQAIVLAPSSLCTVSYLNSVKDPNIYLLGYLYICVLLALVFIIYKLPKFFSFGFSPAFASLTFPMAIGIVATTKMSGYLKTIGYSDLAMFLTQLSGIQLYLTSGIIFYVLLNILIWIRKD